MMKRNWVRILAVVMVVLISSMLYQKISSKELPYIPYISDQNMNWDSVQSVEIYAVGCAIPPSEVITDEVLVKEIVDAARKTYGYKKTSDRYEGIMSHWIRFDNGVVIGIYDSVNYGYVGMELHSIGKAPFYRLPEELFELIKELAVKPVGKLDNIQGIEQNVYKKYDTVEEYFEAMKLPAFIYQIRSGDQFQVVENEVLVGESYTAVNYECKMEAEAFDLQLGTYHFPYGETCLQQIMDGKESLFSEKEIGGNWTSGSAKRVCGVCGWKNV